MGDWYCFNCKEKVVEDEVWLHILDLDRPADGYLCPSCKAIWSDEAKVNELREMEEGMEDK
ncbi:MAG: hypothetical protein V2J25_16285 [Desulfatiglans sp.]|jgi:hypothetical protein|nr:hypothetical protein [Thermodesulfobacteriota bacterium]MEE4354419.1 hypothetical protein [Desulfatiglans sp.]